LVKPAADFYRDKKSKDGYTSSCKDCKTGFQRAYRSRSKDKAKAYKAENAERISEYHRKHKEENRGMHWAISARKRLKDYGYEPVIEEFTLEELVEWYGPNCFYCGGMFEQLDHVVAIIEGGPHVLSNVRPSCRACNMRREHERRRGASCAKQVQINEQSN
jgi:hypothetical protein